MDEQFLTNVLNRIASTDLALTILQVQASLLGAILIFLGFVQVTLSNLSSKRHDSIDVLSNYWASKDIVFRVRFLIANSIAGSIIGLVDTILPTTLLGILSGGLLLISLLGIGMLTFGISSSILGAAPGHSKNE